MIIWYELISTVMISRILGMTWLKAWEMIWTSCPRNIATFLGGPSVQKNESSRIQGRWFTWPIENLCGYQNPGTLPNYYKHIPPEIPEFWWIMGIYPIYPLNINMESILYYIYIYISLSLSTTSISLIFSNICVYLYMTCWIVLTHARSKIRWCSARFRLWSMAWAPHHLSKCFPLAAHPGSIWGRLSLVQIWALHGSNFLILPVRCSFKEEKKAGRFWAHSPLSV